MTEPLASPGAVALPLSPVMEDERISTLDVLRGIALLGVVIANVWVWFSGIAFRFPGYRDELTRVSLDSIVFTAIAVFVSGKAISTFSFLFGHGFAVQMLRAIARGRSIVGTYARRLTVLAIIGFLHMTFLWYGDILLPYAVLGFILMLFRRRSDRTLLTWVTLLVIAVPVVMGAVPLILSAAGVALPIPNLEEIAARNTETLAVFQGTDYSAIVRENLSQASKFYFGRKAVFLLYVLGLFVLGLYVGRKEVFRNVEHYRPVLRRVAAVGISTGLAAGVALSIMNLTFPPSAMMARPGLALAAAIVSISSMLPLAAGYVAAVTLLMQRPAWARRFAVFAPVGRMALTNYLSQTVVLVILFNGYGGGLIGRTGPAFGLLVALTLFAVQIGWSAVWLTYFRFGPMEWLWRSLTYGKMQPMRISPAVPATAV
jgi:uncharacterized protein